MDAALRRMKTKGALPERLTAEVYCRQSSIRSDHQRGALRLVTRHQRLTLGVRWRRRRAVNSDRLRLPR